MRNGLVLMVNLNIMFSFLPQHIPNFIVNINSIGNRIVVSDVQESLHFVRYKRQENQMVIFSDDSHPRFVTASCILDHDTVAVGDKFGNFSVVSKKSQHRGWHICFGRDATYQVLAEE